MSIKLVEYDPITRCPDPDGMYNTEFEFSFTEDNMINMVTMIAQITISGMCKAHYYQIHIDGISEEKEEEVIKVLRITRNKIYHKMLKSGEEFKMDYFHNLTAIIKKEHYKECRKAYRQHLKKEWVKSRT